MHKLWAWSVLLTLLVMACGRYFHTPLQPASRQAEGMTVNDDGSITYALDRLSIELKPMTDAELNRLAPGPDLSNNPYTFGEWTAPGDEWTPPRFTVFRLKVNNYQFPKVKIDPLNAHITTANTRQYAALSYAQLYQYFRLVLVGPHRPRAQDLSSPHRRAQTDAVQRSLGLQRQRRTGVFGLSVLDDDACTIQVHLETSSCASTIQTPP